MTPTFRIAAIVDDIVPVLAIVVMMLPTVALKINSAPEIVPLLVMVVIVPSFWIMGDPPGLESVIPAPTVKLPRVHPLACTKFVLVLEFTA